MAWGLILAQKQHRMSHGYFFTNQTTRMYQTRHEEEATRRKDQQQKMKKIEKKKKNVDYLDFFGSIVGAEMYYLGENYGDTLPTNLRNRDCSIPLETAYSQT